MIANSYLVLLVAVALVLALVHISTAQDVNTIVPDGVVAKDPNAIPENRKLNEKKRKGMFDDLDYVDAVHRSKSFYQLMKHKQPTVVLFYAHWCPHCQ
jgi:thiol-disulfide isomerase/thioredoxin